MNDTKGAAKRKRQEHLGPRVLVDLAEGSPVDVEWKEHLSQCELCAEEVESLKTTLAVVGEGVVPEPDDGYWEDFGSRLSQRLEKERKRPSRRWIGAVAGAAILAIGIWISRDRTTQETAPPPFVETILPPTEEDPEFQALLSIARLSGSDESWEEFLDLWILPMLDPTELTTEERERLRGELEKNIEAGDHAKS